MLVGQDGARSRLARVHAHDPHALLLGPLEIFVGARAEGAVAGAPAPHDDQLGVDVVRRLPPRTLVFRLGAVGHAHSEYLGFRRHVRPQHRAATEHVKEPLCCRSAVQHRQASRPRRIEDCRVAILAAHAEQLAGDLVQRLVPGDALELAAAARPLASQRMLEAVGMVHALDLADTARAGVQGRQLRLPSARVGGYADNAAVDDVRIDGTTTAAVVAAGAGDDGLVRLGHDARCFVDRPSCHPVLSGSDLRWM